MYSRTCRTDYGHFTDDNLCIKGDYNNIKGKNCQVFGDYNYISGDECTIKGDYNNVVGRKCIITGDYNNVSGSGCRIVSGDFNTHNQRSSWFSSQPSNLNLNRNRNQNYTPSVSIGAIGSLNVSAGGRVIVNGVDVTSAVSSPPSIALTPAPRISEQFVVVPLDGKDQEVTDSTTPACIICATNKIQTVIVDCGHSCLCFGCANVLGKGKRVSDQPKCPKCRTAFKQIIQIFTETT